MRPARLRQGLALAAIAALVGAGVAARATTAAPHAARAAAAFDTARAYALVAAQLRYGPRPAGSPAQRRVARRLVAVLPHGRFEPVPGGLRNIVGELPGRGRAIVVAAHYDTTPVPGYLGANNSATGVATVIELARVLARDRAVPAGPPLRFVLFDGEEAPAGFTDFLAQGLRGSRAYAAAHAADTREVVVLDFIALLRERLARESSSTPALWERLRAAAQRARAGALFPAATAPEVLDDHTPFLSAGIPAVDLIDFDYPCWQKTCDDLSQVSRRNLGTVGGAVLALLRAERRRFAAGGAG